MISTTEIFDEDEQYQYDAEYDRARKSYEHNDTEYDEGIQYQPDDEDYNRPENFQPNNNDYYSVNIGDRGSYDDVITPQPSGEPPFSPGKSATEDNFEDASPVQKDHATSPTSESEFSTPTMNDDGLSNGMLFMTTRNGKEREHLWSTFSSDISVECTR
jgi:hypothetical protein